MTPRVSVVIKSYNHAAFVAQAIQSVLDQSFQDFEIVVTDDASTDGTADVIRAFADPRIRLDVFPENRGIPAAMNATLARARGGLIAILNSDDYALPGRLARQVSFLDAHPGVGAVFTMPRTVGESGAQTANFVDFRAALALPDFSRRSWLRRFFFGGNLLCSPTAMIRHTAYQRAGDYDTRLTNLQDFDMWIRMCCDSAFHVMDEELTAFRVRADNKNMSAPRPDSRLRTQFEFAHILKRFRAMSPELIFEVFANDMAERKLDAAKGRDACLAELALSVPSPAHRLFACETLFEIARSDQDIRRIRDVLGRTDIFGIEAARELEATVEQIEQQLMLVTERMLEIETRATEFQRTITLRDQEITLRDQEIGKLRRMIATRDAEVGKLRQSSDRLLNSRSWRYTALPRRIMARVKHAFAAEGDKSKS